MAATDEPEVYIFDFVPPKGTLQMGIADSRPEAVVGVRGLSMKVRSIRTGECGQCAVIQALWTVTVRGRPVDLCRACLDKLSAGIDATNVPPDDFIDIVNDDR